MTLRTSAEIAELRGHLSELKQAAWLDQARRWWPDCLFHCTDISNAVNILRHGELLSRVLAKEHGLLSLDIASADIIAQTDPRWKEYVRFYFRPRTPTQYRNEGFRPPKQQRLGSHCPVPIYFVFNALSVLSRSDSKFTDGNAAASGSTPKNDVAFLKQIPFEFVYHDSPFDSSEPNTIVYHRNAEVMVPERIGLESVSFVGCRSVAEYETLLHLLSPGSRSRWIDKIGVRPDLRLFFREWTFIERADLSDEEIIFRFNPNSRTPGPFNSRVELSEQATGKRYSWNRQDHSCLEPLKLNLHNLRNAPDYTVRLFLDAQLAYANRYQREELPF